MWDFLKVMAICFTCLFALFLILLALPKSKLRCLILEMGGWSTAALSAVYIISPIDLIPDFLPVIGWVDDLGALVAGIVALLTAISARHDRQLLESSKEHTSE